MQSRVVATHWLGAAESVFGFFLPSSSPIGTNWRHAAEQGRPQDSCRRTRLARFNPICTLMDERRGLRGFAAPAAALRGCAGGISVAAGAEPPWTRRVSGRPAESPSQGGRRSVQTGGVTC